MAEDLFIGSKILFSLSGCILSLTNSSKILLPNWSTVMRLSNISLEYICPVMMFLTEQFQSWITLTHQARLLMQICFHFDPYSRAKITGDVSKMFWDICSTNSQHFFRYRRQCRGSKEMSYSTVFIPCYACNATTVFYYFIYLLTSVIPFNCRSRDIEFLTADIYFHKYNLYIRNSMLKIVHISLINRSHSTIFHSVHARKIQHHFFSRFKVEKPVARWWGLNKIK